MNPEFFAKFQCYFNYLDTNKVSLHFNEEFIEVEFDSDNIKTIKSMIHSTRMKEVLAQLCIS